MSDPFELLKARYGAGQPLPAVAADRLNPVLETLFAHRSVRDYRPDPLPPDTLDLLVAAAQSAPSSSNLQVWSVVAIEDAARRARFAELVGNQKQVREAPLFLAWLVDLSRLRRIAAERGRELAGIDYLDTFLMGVIDAALAAQNVVNAAESLGLGTVYIGALRNEPEAVAAELGIAPGDGVYAVFGLCVGYPDATKPASVKPRLPQTSVLYRERYAPAPVQEEVAGYDAAMHAFYTSQGLPPNLWSEHSVARLRTPADLKGRHRLREALAALGFALR
ncbi:NADPH-dependent oxidoreductase [Pseudoduganella armeniaca]|uniref:NADPH-dependent oxidoreductase n=1 Tax=Pseudoduganella armeniaca TaxID=2072590 RepID=A0A2R4C4J9_9BURK|nr:NADPH-dependent oxidoreductase [Pseudoduganella armeniaca]AVR94546.1 NADPH-dependent oxidoreductase [Pseudoduganella armeniaca]